MIIVGNQGFGLGNANTFQFGPEQNVFGDYTGDLIAVKALLDAYALANPDWLAVYEGNSFLLVQLLYVETLVNTAAYYSYVGGQWVNAFNQALSGAELGTHSVTELLDVTNAGSGQIITAAERIKLDGIETGAQVNVPTDLSISETATTVTINSSTGTDVVIPNATNTLAGVMSSAEHLKLSGIATNATANQTDAYLLARENQTGEQAISTITGLQTALDNKLGDLENAVSSSKLATARDISLSGDATGTVSFDGTSNVDIVVTVQDNSHLHTINNVTGLQTALNAKLDATANAVSATKLQTSRNIALSGDVTGTIPFDGTADINIVATVQDNSHNHTIANITGLQTALDGKVDESVQGLTIHRFIQVSNGANATATPNNINTTTILPLLATGSFNAAFNNTTGYGNLDLVNNWINVANINPNANLSARVTLLSNGGAVSNAVLVMRLIPDITTPLVFTDIINIPQGFSTQAALMTAAYHGGIDAIQFGIRTASAENIRLVGVYLSIDDIFVP